MGGQRARDMLIKIGDGGSPETFATVAGIRTRTLALAAGAVDATSADSPGAWRELLAGAAAKRLDVSGSGVFKDAASDARLRQALFDGATVSLQLIVPDFGVMSGEFQVVELTWGGEHDGEATFSIRLSSAGAVTFEAST